MTREDSDSRLMTRDSAPGKSNDSRLDSHDSCTAMLIADISQVSSIECIDSAMPQVERIKFLRRRRLLSTWGNIACIAGTMFLRARVHISRVGCPVTCAISGRDRNISSWFWNDPLVGAINSENSGISPSRIMRLCNRIICIFHYARIIVQGAHNLHIIVFLRNSQFFEFFILSSVLIPSVGD